MIHLKKKIIQTKNYFIAIKNLKNDPILLKYLLTVVIMTHITGRFNVQDENKL